MSDKFSVILSDPPWSFRVWNRDTGSGRSAESHYPTMTMDELYALPVPGIADKNCALFLWAVWPSLPDALKLIDAWGFTYKTVAWVWVKGKRRGLGFHMGMGYYTRANTEPCLLAIKGNMPVAAHDVLALIYAPVREHSRKPDEQYGKIERLYPGKSYAELFARHRRERWASWGNEIDSNITWERDIEQWKPQAQSLGDTRTTRPQKRSARTAD